MHRYFDGAIALTSICSIGLAALSLVEGTIAIADEQPDTVQAIQLQGIDNSLAANLKSLDNISPITITESASQPVSIVAVNMIKEFEGFETHAYIDTDGTAVIGYGLSKIEGKPVQIGDRISTKEADSALNRQLKTIQQELDQAITVNLSDDQLGALASLSFNVGVNFVENSTLISKINAGDHHGAADEFLRWDKANVKGRLVQLPGLTRRRQAERQLFLEGITPVKNS